MTPPSFHRKLYEYIVEKIGYTMRQAVLTARQADLSDIGTQQGSLPHHTAMLASIQNHDPDAAYNASRAMFDQVWNFFL